MLKKGSPVPMEDPGEEWDQIGFIVYNLTLHKAKMLKLEIIIACLSSKLGYLSFSNIHHVMKSCWEISK